ncbi:related to SWD1 - subunit of the COMPASS complex [Ustilago trichophora]|uniref:Related to SWD1 - subunit of the COMPASS complex n=1 Tax=Ustilago trichophora TaxID=86804 RepID=A0A5C3DQP7_9BASI|nr:related to SWD1 - subunit of the COMPASS complex [Ustilago trichophora]
MNAQLLNPFSIDIPDTVSNTLSSAECSVLSFNHGFSTLAGQYLAIGRSDGYITIWDIETKSVLRLLGGHVRPVKSLAWSSYNRYLASCAGDWNVVIWDLAAKSAAGPSVREGERRRGGDEGEGEGEGEGEVDPRLPFATERKVTIRFDCAVVSVQFAPGNSKRLVVVLASNEAYLVDISQKILIRRRQRCSSSNTPLFEVQDINPSPQRIPLLNTLLNPEEAETTSPKPGITAARFTPDSRHILAGTTKGTLLIFDALSGQLVTTSSVLGTSSAVKELSFDISGKFVVVNCNDRSLRILSVSTTYDSCSASSWLHLIQLHKVQDMIQRTPWVHPSFTPSSDYIFAGASHKAAHNVYIWDRSSGTLSKILEGPKDWVVGVDWHPTRPMVASVSNTGAVYIWFSPSEEIWSAYAPGFEELEENIEYQEREDEFDFAHEGEEEGRRRRGEVEAADVRVEAGKHGNRVVTKQVDGNVDAETVWQLLGLEEEEKNGWEGKRFWMALRRIEPELLLMSSDSGWKKEQGKEEQVRALEYTLRDDDTSDAFVIPPRLEVDYSDFHDDHL